MNSNSNSINKKRILLWKDSFFIWSILILIQIVLFSILIALLLEISGVRINPFFQFFGIYGSSIGIWMGVFVTEIGTLLISIYYLKIFKIENLKMNELAGINEFNFHNLLLGAYFVPIIFFTGNIVSYIQSIFIYSPNESSLYYLIYKPSNIWELIVWIVIMLIIVGPCEEIVFRGIIQKGFQNSFKKNEKPEWYAIFFSSLLFSIFHVDLPHFLPIFFMGLLLGMIFYYTNSSLICAVSHGIYDSFSIILIFLL